MKRKITLLGFSLILNSTFGQYARVALPFPWFTDTKDHSMAFACSKEDRTPEVYFCEIEQLDPNHIQIINHTPSPSFGGEQIKIILNRDLRIDAISYSSWTDLEDDSHTTYDVESPSIILNSNPFITGVKRFEGNYTFIIKESYFLTRQVVTPKVSYRLFNGKFICSWLIPLPFIKRTDDFTKR